MKPIQIEVFSSPGCSRCGQGFDVLQTITQELGAERIEWRDVYVDGKQLVQDYVHCCEEEVGVRFRESIIDLLG